MSVDVSTIKQNKVARYKCESSLLFHTRYFFMKKNKKKFIVSQHHKMITDALERVLRGECTRLIINIAPRYGKAIDCDTYMLTTCGWKKAGEISVGDNLFGSNGDPTKVLAVYPQGTTDAYRVTFTDNSSIITCGEHLWSIKNRNQRGKKWKYKNCGSATISSTKELIGNIIGSDGHKKWHLPKCEPLNFPHKKLIIDPYLFGCWLGDEHSHSASITTMDKSIIDKFAEYDPIERTHQNSGKATTYGLRNNFITKLKALDVFKNKRIPFEYLTSSIEQRIELLRGICDTDGTCNKRNNQVSVCSTNKTLYDDIKVLIASLGGYYTEYRHSIMFRVNFCPFHLDRKKQYYRCPSKKHHVKRYFKSIERVEDRETVCFTVDSADNLFRAGKDLIITHNTELAVKNFISHGLSLNPAAKFIHLSYSDSLALDNSEEVKDLIEEDFYQELFPEVRIKKDSKAKNKWYTDKGGGVYARSAAGQVTGFGAGSVDEEDDEEANEWVEDIGIDVEIKKRFAGAIIIDDPIKPEDADSDVVRERVNQRFDSTIRNRVNSRNTPIIIIMQRLHPRDLAGYVMEIDGVKEEGGDWEVLSLPCMFVNENNELQALWEHKHTIEELKKMKKGNDIVFERQYQQNPKPREGLLFPDDELNFYNPQTIDIETLAEFKFCYVDPADDGGDDLSAPLGYLIGDKIYIDKVIYNTHGTDINEAACVEMIVSNKVNACNIEGNSAWKLFAQSVRRKVEDDRGYIDCEIRIVKSTTNKHTRILAQSSFIKNHFVFRSDYKDDAEYYKFIQCLTSYMRIQEGTSKNKHDDAPDSLTGMAAYYVANFQHVF